VEVGEQGIIMKELKRQININGTVYKVHVYKDYDGWCYSIDEFHGKFNYYSGPYKSKKKAFKDVKDTIHLQEYMKGK
jgi:hypothetical protein